MYVPAAAVNGLLVGLPFTSCIMLPVPPVVLNVILPLAPLHVAFVIFTLKEIGFGSFTLNTV